jgi:hypothetical protein
MSEELRITKLEISKPYEVLIRTRRADVLQIWIDVTIHVENTTSHTKYLFSSIRKLLYDEKTKTLSLLLSDPDMNECWVRHGFAPSTVAIPSLKTAEIQIRIPKKIKQLQPGGKFEIRVIDFASVHHLKVQISHSNTDLRPKPSNVSQPGTSNASPWTQFIETSIELGLGKDEGGIEGKLA